MGLLITHYSLLFVDTMEIANDFELIERINFSIKDSDFYIQQHLKNNKIGFALGIAFNKVENYLVLGMLFCTVETDVARATKHFQKSADYYLQFLDLQAEHPEYYSYGALSEFELGLFVSILGDNEPGFSRSLELLDNKVVAKNTERFWVYMCGALQAALRENYEDFSEHVDFLEKIRKRKTEKYYLVYLSLYEAYLQNDSNKFNEALEACSKNLEERKKDDNFVDYSGIDGDPYSNCTPFIFDYRATAIARLARKRGMEVTYFDKNIPKMVVMLEHGGRMK